jgi:uncharacterized membrane protein YbhN (UPF0104 family)
VKLALRVVAVAIVLLVASRYLIRHGHEFRLLLDFDFRYAVPIFLVHLAALCVNGLVTRRLVGEFGIRLRFEEWYGLSVVHALGNYLPIPQAGILARGLYLKRAHGLDYTSFTATLLVAYLQFMGVLGVVGMAALVAWALAGSSIPWPLFGIFLVLASCGLALTELPWALPGIRRWRRLVSGLGLLRNRRVLLDLLWLQLLLILFAAIGIWLSFQSLGRPLGGTASLLLALVAAASAAVNVTPGNLGVAEAAAWLTARLLKGDADVAVVAYTVFRLIAVIAIMTLGPYFLFRLSARIGDDEGERKPQR